MVCQVGIIIFSSSVMVVGWLLVVLLLFSYAKVILRQGCIQVEQLLQGKLYVLTDPSVFLLHYIINC